MKKFLLSAIMCLTTLTVFAQGDIQFSILQTRQTEFPQSVIDALHLKIQQIMTRNNAASTNPYNVFAIEPTISIIDISSSDGLVQNISVAQGELTLIAKNTIDGALYYSVVIPLKCSVTGNADKALESMIKGIKITNPAFTRFIRISREKIDKYYADNCATILLRAQELNDTGKNQEVLSYLSAVSESVSCYEQASQLRREIYNPPTPDTVVIEHINETPPTNNPVPENIPDETTPSVPEIDIRISSPDLDFKLMNCTGSLTNGRITIVAKVTNLTNETWQNIYVNFKSAFTNTGDQLSSLSSQAYWQKFPARIPLTKEFYITKLMDKIESLSFVELSINNVIVEIRNLKVEWQ